MTQLASRKKLAKLFAAFDDRLDDKYIEGILQTQEGNINYVMPSSEPLQSVDHTSLSGTVIHQLRKVRKDEIFRILNVLIKYGADITIRNSEGQTVLHSEIMDGYKLYSNLEALSDDSIINVVLSAHVEHRVSKNPCDDNGISHFVIACMYKHKQAIDFFLKNGVNVNQAINKDSKIFPGYTPLHFAAHHSCLETMQKLLECGADVNSKNAEGLTPLQQLIKKNLDIVSLRSSSSNRLLSECKVNQTMIHLLLTSGNSNNNNHINHIERYGSGFSNFHAACSLEDTSLAKNLLIHVKDVNGIIDMDAAFCPGYSALHFAAHFSVDLVKLLLVSEANILAKDANGVTPLDICLQRLSILDIRSILQSVLVPDVVKNALGDQGFQARLGNMFKAMLTEHTHELFLASGNDVDCSIDEKSPLWPGYTILHLAVLMSERDRAAADDPPQSNEKPVGDWQKNKLIEKCMMSGADCTIQDSRSLTPVHFAFYLQKRNSLRYLLDKHVKTTNPVDENGVSHLHVACSEGMYETAEKLVQNGADVNLATRRTIKLSRCTTENDSVTFNLAAGCTPLHMAVIGGNEKVVKLLERNGANVNATNADGWSAVHTAMLLSYPTSMGKALFTCSTKLKERIVDDVGLSHLHVACCVDSLKAVKKLIKLGSDVNATIKGDLKCTGHYCPRKCKLLCENSFAGFTPLHFALRNGSTKIASVLLEFGANVSVTSSHVISPLFQVLSTRYMSKSLFDLFVAHLRGSEDLQKRLQEDTGMTLLHIYALKMNLDAIEDLLDAGVDVNAKIRSDSSIWPGYTTLHMWVYGLTGCRSKLSSAKCALKLLLDGGADVTLPDAHLDTPLHSFNCSHVTMTDEYSFSVNKMMLDSQKDFSVNPVNSAGFTHFHISCRICDLQSAKEFLKLGVDVNQRFNDFSPDRNRVEKPGCTPLHLVTHTRLDSSKHRVERMKMVDLLLENGADPGASDILGNTPLHEIAKLELQRLELAEKIVRAGGAIDAVNVRGDTPFSILLKSHKISAEEIEFFLQQGCRMNVYNPIDKTGFLALPVYQLYHGFSTKHVNDIYKLLIKNPDIKNIDDLGRTALHNFVSTSLSAWMLSENWVNSRVYPEVVERLVKQGCDVNAQDKTGKTALHVAAQFKNNPGLSALLKAGGDLNITDAKGLSVLDYASDACQSGTKASDRHKVLIRMVLVQLRTMQFAGISVHKCNNERTILKLLKKCQMTLPTIKQNKAEIEKTKEVSIGNLGSIRLYDFFSETGAVAAYSTMSRLKRRAVDKFFTKKNKVLADFHEVKGLLKLQYRKSVMRAGLITFAMDSLRKASGIPLPELCCNHVLRYLGLSDIQNLVDSTKN